MIGLRRNVASGLVLALAVQAGTLVVLVAAAVPWAAIAQENEQILARMEFEQVRLYSGAERNLAALLQNALRQKRAMPPGGGILPRGLVDTRWRALGPDRVMDGTVATAGRVSAIAIHPTDMNIIYAGGAQGGVWRSDDAGENWRPSDRPGVLSGHGVDRDRSGESGHHLRGHR